MRNGAEIRTRPGSASHPQRRGLRSKRMPDAAKFPLRRPATKKGDSSRNLPRSQTWGDCKLFGSLGGLCSSSVRRLGSGLAAGRRVTLLLGATLTLCLRSSCFSSSGLSSIGSLLVRVATATYHGNGSQNDDKRKNLFHRTYNFYLARQRYIFGGKKQSKKIYFFISSHFQSRKSDNESRSDIR